MLSDLQGVPEPDAKLPSPSVPAPRVRVVQTDAGHALEPGSDGGANQNNFCAQFLAAFGTAELVVAEVLPPAPEAVAV